MLEGSSKRPQVKSWAMSDQFSLRSEDREFLVEIWRSRAWESPNHDKKSQIEASVKSELSTLARSLHEQNFFWPAEAIAGFLLGETKSLDAAFGLKRRLRGRPLSNETVKRDADALELHFIDGCSYNKIARETGMDRKEVRGVCENRAGYERRCHAAFVEILGCRIAESNSTSA